MAFTEYQAVQLNALRELINPEQWITHNFMEWFSVYDHAVVARDLDFVSWDYYPADKGLNLMNSGSAHDFFRGLKRKRFWLMETQPGCVNWAGVNPHLPKGGSSLNIWHAIGHGAAAALFWQWRRGRGGQEQYHGSIVNEAGDPRPLYQEVVQLGEEIAGLQDILCDAQFSPPVAMIFQQDDRWAIDFQRHHRNFDPLKHFQCYYRGIREQHCMVDILPDAGDLDSYQIVICPSLHLMKDGLSQKLTEFVRAGGTLILGPRSGARNEENTWPGEPLPLELSKLAGIQIEEFYALENPVTLKSGGSTKIWAEQLALRSERVEIWDEFEAPEHHWLHLHPAITCHPVGKGKVVTIAGWLDEHSLKNVLQRCMKASGIESPFQGTDPLLEICSFESQGKTFWILLNPTGEELGFQCSIPVREYKTAEGNSCKHSVVPYQKKILTKVESP